MNILVVDDSEDLRELLEDHCTVNGHQVITAENGEEALNIIKSRADLDLIISDNDMPKLKGIDLFKELETSKLSYPPFILWTGDTNSLLSEIHIGKLFGFLEKGEGFANLDALIIKAGYSKYSRLIRP